MLAPRPLASDSTLRREVRRAVQAVIDPETVLARRATSEAAIRRELATLTESAARERGAILPAQELADLQQYVINDVLGYGPIQPLLDDPSIQEVMVNAPREVFVEREGRIERSDAAFDDEAHVMAVIERLLRRLGRRVDESSPAVDARIPEAGFRVHVIIPPLALKGPTITIRKFPKLLGLADLVRIGAVSEEAASFLRAAVAARANIIVSGGTGSGKTTLLNALSEFIPDNERIVTIEDTAELQLRRTHVVALQARPANVEGKGAYTIRDLVVHALRMRPDRLIVGEVRREEALDMLQAMNTGHDGSLTTVHANDPADVVSRLETMVLQSGVSYPLRAIRGQIASALHLIVHVARTDDGRRAIESIAEFGALGANDDLPVRSLFARDGEGGLRSVARPTFVGRLPRRLQAGLEAALPR
ncbi:MAG TPA: CpaF family protein [Candidatus Limnocylindria bacterium]